tara:strand:+ start:331 stop:576 length:246 start_codon:yes stop_codon:yes gene_type:complete
VKRRCKLTGKELPSSSTARRTFIDDRARVLNGRIALIEQVCEELQSMNLDRDALAAVRARLWRAGNYLVVGRKKNPEDSVP